MGENKGHGNKAPNYPELDETESANSRTGARAGNSQPSGSMQSSGKQQGSMQQGGQQQGSPQDSSKRQDIGNAQGADGQRQNQQHGGQHASGGTPALDDLNANLDSNHQGPLGNAPEQMDQQSRWKGKQDKNR